VQDGVDVVEDVPLADGGVVVASRVPRTLADDQTLGILSRFLRTPGLSSITAELQTTRCSRVRARE
jgi:hypothetical protein